MKTIAMYLRLSSKDTKMRRGEIDQSESISNQRAMIKEYVRNNIDFAGMDILEFIDDGWSGKNFDRPAFKKMIELARQEKIHCIIVKDLSRLGRDYLVVGNYLFRVFPFLNLRVIALNDNYDSKCIDVNSLDTPLKTLIYDYYSRDLSRKIKSAKLEKAKRGDFLSPYAPFGYKKNPENKNRLVVDEIAAKVVKMIFENFLNGKTKSEIARELNDREIPTPMIYKRENGCSRGRWPSISNNNYWHKGTIGIILKDIRYTGKVVYGTKKRKAMGINRVICTPKENWIIVDNTHEAIISNEIFQAVQSKIKKMDRGEVKKRKYLLHGKVLCGVCRHAMLREAANQKNAYYLCETNRYFTECSCPKEKISAKDLEETVLRILRENARCFTDEKELESIENQQKQKKKDTISKNILGLKEKKYKLEKESRRLYEDFIEGKLNKESYLEKKAMLRKQINLTKDQYSVLEKELEKSTKVMPIKYNAESLTRDMIDEIVEKIYIYPGLALDIKLNFGENLSSNF